MLTRTLLAAISRPPISLKTMSAAARPTRSSRSSAAALALATNASTVPRTVKAEPIVDEEVDVKPSTSSVVKKRRAPSPAASTPKKTRRATPTDAASMTAASPDSKPPKPPAAAGTTPKKFAAYLTSPFPDYSAPTAAECERVTELLAGLHGMPQRPGRVEKLPEGEPPRVGEACGAVPSVLDALIRTILSQNTTNANSARAYASLLATFGPSASNARAVSLPAVFRAELAEVQDSIRCGGLANVKGKVIKNVLQTVYERNARAAAEGSGKIEEADEVKPDVKVEPAHSPSAAKPRALKRSPSADPPLIALASPSDSDLAALLSLDAIHALPDDEAMRSLESFPGVGPKTASCVLLFCLARESFAVDTHVFRLSKALGWVPARATRETTYEHLDSRIPGALKYPLHVLLIAHGKSCVRCAARGKTSRPSVGACPLVGLGKRGKVEEAEGEGEEDEGGEVGGGPEELEVVVKDDVEAALVVRAG